MFGLPAVRLPGLSFGLPTVRLSGLAIGLPAVGLPELSFGLSYHDPQSLLLIAKTRHVAPDSLHLFQVFCEEAGSDAGYFRQFVAATYARFWARYAPRLGLRPHCYEVSNGFTITFYGIICLSVLHVDMRPLAASWTLVRGLASEGPVAVLMQQ